MAIQSEINDGMDTPICRSPEALLLHNELKHIPPMGWAFNRRQANRVPSAPHPVLPLTGSAIGAGAGTAVNVRFLAARRRRDATRC